ncbi:MAG: hypothetical protein O2848_02135 [Proteobacteria bacterium]|nr:hypothetical protein [Pseudomonadota bacterium]MDA0847378.1 hypothetical protein [Pseudomonadota bacterium]
MNLQAKRHWSAVLVLVGLVGLSVGMPAGMPHAAAAKKEPVNCYISERKINRDNTRINCIYKCPDGRSESEVVPRATQCPAKIEVLR